MAFDYIINPQKIEQESFKQIRELTTLDGLSKEQQQVVMRIVHSVGITEVAEQVRFSKTACQSGLSAIKNNSPILCDVEMVKQGITKRFLNHPPLCYLNDSKVEALAKSVGETRTMVALQL